MPLGRRAVTDLLSPTKIGNIAKYSYADNAYKPEEYIKDLTTIAFRETATGKAVGAYRRNIQTTFVTEATRWYDSAPANTKVYYYSMLRNLYERLTAARSSDAATNGHYHVLRQMIDDCLNKK